MDELQSNTLYNAARNSDNLILLEDKTPVGCCCISEEWCFNHGGLPSLKIYDKNANNCCTCLDCCSWCLEFRRKKMSICKKQTNCYLCCCSIYFT